MKSKILFILHWPPPVHGSSVVGLQIKESKNLNANFDCHFINLGTSKSIDEIGRNAIKKIFRYLSILSKVLINLITNRPDICYIAIAAKGIPFYKDALVISLVKLFRIRLIYHFHNKGIRARQDRFIDNLLYSFVFKDAYAILLSKYLYADVQTFITETKIFICPNGIAKGKIQHGATTKKQKRVVKILFLSNLIETKGVFILLEACSILKEKKIQFECDFIGGEGDISEVQFQDKVNLLGLTNHINYLGARYGAEKNRAFYEADIFAFPTYNECFPLVLLEALQYSLPIVSTFEGGIRDIVDEGQTGFLVPQNNAPKFAEKLEQLIINPSLCKQMGAAGRAKYEQKFTKKKFENRLEEILNQIVG